jgi:multicomponent Na+:H+ antiporter subunit D
MADHAPIFIIITPMFGALLVILLGMRNKAACLPVSLITMALSLSAAIVTLVQVIGAGEIRYRLGGWAPPFGIEYRVDALSALVLVAIAGVAFLNVIYSAGRVTIETPKREPIYYALLLLLISGLAGMTITNDAFNLYVLLEISSLTSYALIAVGSRRAVLASFNYVIMGTIGASFYLLGVGYLYIKTGSLNMDDIHRILVEQGLADSKSIHVGFILIMLGVWIKMAFFPLHGWLPNAYAYSPTVTGTTMAPLVTKVMIYIMIRMMLTVFGAEYVFKSLGWSQVIVWLSSIAIVAGSIFALSRRSLRKMLCYLIVAEVGYMVGGAWLANESGMVGAMYHILSDAFMTLCLFFAVGIVILRTGEHRLIAFRGLFNKMPITMVGFTIGALSMIGLPPTCGFFSKWYLIQGGIEAGHWEYVAALIFSSLVNAILFFRLFEMAYLKDLYKPEDEDAINTADPDDVPEKEITLPAAPWTMLGPMLFSAAMVLVIGIFNRKIIEWLSSVAATVNVTP